MTSVDGPAGAPATLARFSLATRLLHWTVALPFVCLLLTGLLIFIPEVKAFHIGGHRLVALVHVVVGVGFIVAVPLALLIALGQRASRCDLQRALTPERGDDEWARWAVTTALGARSAEPPSGKFNFGQKLSTACWWVLTAGLMATGAVLAVNYFTKRVFDAAFVGQVYPWHTALMVASLPLLAAHLYLALVNRSTRPSLRGMLGGRVDAAWARRQHARWADGDEFRVPGSKRGR